jgi:hypothetical protein
MRRRLAEPLVSTSLQLEENAAWELLDAVRELFPEKFAELDAIGYEAYDKGVYSPVELPDDLKERVWNWTEENGIACDAVDDVALRFAGGMDWPRRSLTKVRTASGEPVDTTPSIHANPFDETLDEFVARAKRHYNEATALFRNQGYKKGPFKHQESDHFRYLAAQRVGGYSLARIADGQTPLNLPVKDQRTIAEGVRETAHLIGLPIGKPGRPRSRVPPAATRIP